MPATLLKNGSRKSSVVSENTAMSAKGITLTMRAESFACAVCTRIERRSNEEPNGTTGVPPELLFMREKDALRPLGNRALLESMLGEVSYQTVPATMLVRCAGREFSVPRRMIGRRARLVLSADGVLRVYDGGDLVSVHDTRAPGGPVVYVCFVK